MCVKLNSLFDREMTVYYATKVLKQGINLKMMLPKYKPEFANTTSQVLSRRVGQDRNCHRISRLLNCWSLLL